MSVRPGWAPRAGLAGPAVLAMFAVLAVLASGCTAPPPQNEAEVRVYAAASLRSAFEELARRYEASYPGRQVTLNFGGSADLATQLSAGAPADIFAAADTSIMQRLVEDGVVTGAVAIFATNTLAIAVQPGNPQRITGLESLARAGADVVLCAPQVPCGAAADRVQDAAGVTLAPVSEESSVAGVMGKVLAGEADAGLVYATDVRAAGARVSSIPLGGAAAHASYPVGTLAGRETVAASDFIALLTGPVGAGVLREAGFGAAGAGGEPGRPSTPEQG